jgi:hypothetical protein
LIQLKVLAIKTAIPTFRNKQLKMPARILEQALIWIVNSRGHQEMLLFFKRYDLMKI